MRNGVSLNDGPTECKPLTFTVYADGKPLWIAKAVTIQADLQTSPDLSVAGVGKLKIEIQGTDIRSTHAAWIEPHLMK